MVQSAGASGVQAWGTFTRSNTHIENIGRPQSRNNRKSRKNCFLAIIVRRVKIAIEIIVVIVVIKSNGTVVFVMKMEDELASMTGIICGTCHVPNLRMNSNNNGTGFRV